MGSKVRWGILSTAKIGVQKVIPAMQGGKFTRVDAIASRDIARANSIADKLNIKKRYGSYEELLADPDIDAIYNPLPNNLHVPWTQKAMEAGKHVLCEKPIGMNAAEAYELEEAVQRFPQLKVMEAFMYRFHPQWAKVQELVADGAVGEVKTIHTFFSYHNIDPKNIRNRTEVGGGALMDIGCYCISFPRFIFNEEPSEIVGDMDYDPVMKTDRLTSAMLRFPSGKTSVFTCSTQLMPYQQTNIFGDMGQIRVEIPVNPPPNESVRIILKTKDKTDNFSFDPVDQYTLQGDMFSKAILADEDVPIPLIDAIGNMKVIEAVISSAREKKWTNL